MRTLTGRRYAAAAATAVLLLSAAGCGKDDTDNAAADATPTVATGTPTEPTETTEPAGEEVDPTEFASKITSAMDTLTTAHIAMQVEAQGALITATGLVNYSADSPEMALKMTSASFGSGTVDMRLVDKAMYMSLPEGVGQTGKLYKIDLDDPNNPLGADLGNLTTFDPKSTFDTFTTGLQKVVDVGEEDIDGEATTHYVLTTDTAKIKKTLPKSQRAGFPDSLTYDVWLDSGDRVRKMVADMPGSGQLTIKMSHWGEPVDISAPPAKLVVQFPSQ
jgi:hypothetical protein